ncbi:MAG: metal ABC transporter substrate-binding protein [Aquificaceae bacterium]|nr:metal ABC transporter substrate-binding protein [Aquificaceae bacterium]MDW8237396.1 metal ABC transporter substrate-binding protein [Aquificaceae bacterium]
MVLLLLLFPIIAYASWVASTYPIYHILKALAPNGVEVKLLAGGIKDPHHYELKPSDIKLVGDSSRFFHLNSEAFEKNLVKTFPEKSVDLSKNLQLIDGNDPHIWLSPRSYQDLAKSIHAKLIQLDSANRQHYDKKLEEVLKTLRSLDSEYSKTLKNCKSRVILSTHMSFAYIARDYGFKAMGLSGVHAEAEPKPSQAKVLKEARALGASSLFHEPGERVLAKRLAPHLRPIEINISLAGEDLSSIFLSNLKALSTGLECQ